jgi:acyl-CoA dehydrogenase
MQLYEGTSQIQRLVIAREILMPRQTEEPAVERPLAIAA